MKKYIRYIIIMIFIFSVTSVCQVMAYTTSELGENILGVYFQLGEYNDEPILWKCVDVDDENGVLLLSDKIICYKAYNAGKEVENDSLNQFNTGVGIWEDSTIRAWLNATENAGDIIWPGDNPPDYRAIGGPYLPYADENGFLSDDNFTETERSVMKSVSQWQILGAGYAQLSTNGVKFCFQTDYYPPPYVSRYGTSSGFVRSKVGDLSHIEGAMYRVSDTIFLIDEVQAYNIYQIFGTIYAEPTENAIQSIADDKLYGNPLDKFRETGVNKYVLRSSNGGAMYVANDDDYGRSVPAICYGIRPAFYLNTDAATIKSGSGTEEEPYIIDGIIQEDTLVFCNGEQVQFDVQPIYENDRLLVPVRAIFESLGAEVTYDDGDGVITATNDERTVVMQIDNLEMGNGTKVITLDVAPQIVGDRTMVPLRAVAEAYDCQVDYIENLNRVVIDKPDLPMDFGERPEHPNENWQRNDFAENFPGWEPF